MTLYDASGTAAGVGAATLGPGTTLHWAEAAIQGAGGLSPMVSVQEIIMGGVASGAGSVYDTLLVLAAGMATGQGMTTGAASHIIGIAGSTLGQGVLNFSEPLPMVGIGNIVAFAQIFTYPPPICQPICGCGSCCGRSEVDCPDCFMWHRRRHHCEAWWWQCRECWERHAWHRMEGIFPDQDRHHHEWRRSPNPGGLIGSFRWNQILGRGDLEICITDRWGNQRGPVFIGYTMFTVSTTGIMHQVGPTDRKPAQADVGKYYVTGTAGENGQPGCWAIRWRYQKTYGEPIYEQIQQFRVLDAVLDCARPDHPDHLRRHCKYGWDL